MDATILQFITVISRHELAFLNEKVSLLKIQYKKAIQCIEETFYKISHYQKSFETSHEQQKDFAVLLKGFQNLSEITSSLTWI